MDDPSLNFPNPPNPPHVHHANAHYIHEPYPDIQHIHLDVLLEQRRIKDEEIKNLLELSLLGFILFILCMIPGIYSSFRASEAMG